MSDDDKSNYDRKTLLTAALLFIGFCLLVYSLPTIMLSLGEQNQWFGAIVIAAFLVLPFVGFWLRGKMRRK